MWDRELPWDAAGFNVEDLSSTLILDGTPTVLDEPSEDDECAEGLVAFDSAA